MDETTASEMQNWPYYGKNAVGCTAVAIAQDSCILRMFTLPSMVFRLIGVH